MKHRLLILLLLVPALLLSGCKDSADDPAVSPENTPSTSRKDAMTKRYHSILSGDSTFFSVDAQQDVTVEQLSTTLGEDSGAGVKISAFSRSDLDGDGEDEVLLWLVVDTNHSYGYTVLHHQKSSVYGYTVPFSSLLDLRSDGTFSFYNGEDDRGSARIKFTEAGWELDKITYRTGITSFADGQSVETEAFEQALLQQSGKIRASWPHFNEANIEKHFAG